jgi:hypothetical protein
VKSTNYKAPRYTVFLHSLITTSLFGPDIFLRTLFSYTLSLCSSRNVRDQVQNHRENVSLVYSNIYIYIYIIYYVYTIGNSICEPHTLIELRNLPMIMMILTVSWLPPFIEVSLNLKYGLPYHNFQFMRVNFNSKLRKFHLYFIFNIQMPFNFACFFNCLSTEPYNIFGFLPGWRERQEWKSLNFCTSAYLMRNDKEL